MYWGLQPALALDFKSPECFGLNSLSSSLSIKFFKDYYIGFYYPPWLKPPGYMLFNLCAGKYENIDLTHIDDDIIGKFSGAS